MGEIRKRRIEHTMKEIIGTMILHHEIKDPRLSEMVCITEVSVSDDTKHAKVFVSYYGDATVCDAAVETLNRAAGFIQAAIAKRMRLRNTPKLHFVIDHSIEKGFRITQKLKEITIDKSDS